MTSDDLDLIFGALSDPTRRAILARLQEGEATVNELVAPFDISQPAISKHLKVLEKAGLISRRRDAQRRPCRLETETLAQVAGWLEPYLRDGGAPDAIEGPPAPARETPKTDPGGQRESWITWET